MRRWRPRTTVILPTRTSEFAGSMTAVGTAQSTSAGELDRATCVRSNWSCVCGFSIIGIDLRDIGVSPPVRRSVSCYTEPRDRRLEAITRTVSEHIDIADRSGGSIGTTANRDDHRRRSRWRAPAHRRGAGVPTTEPLVTKSEPAGIYRPP